MIFIPKIFLQPLNSFEIIFRLQQKSARKRISRHVLVCLLFIAGIFLSTADEQTIINLTFSFQKRRMSREYIVRSLEVGKVWQESQVSGTHAGSLFIILVARERIELIIEASDD